MPGDAMSSRPHESWHIGLAHPHSTQFVQELIVCFADLPLGDIYTYAGGANRSPAVTRAFEKCLARVHHPPHLARIRATDSELSGRLAVSLWIKARRHLRDETCAVVRVDEAHNFVFRQRRPPRDSHQHA